MLNNLLLAKGDRLRLYDQYGGWQFSTRDGRLEAQESDVVQPGWPRGRRTPKNDVMAERWPWVGWDRVTACEILAGRNVYNMNAAGVAPDRRGAGRMGKQWLFPGVGRWGIYLQGGVKQGHWVLHAARWGEAEPPEDKLPWKPRKLTLDPKAYVFTDGGKSLLLAGGLPFGAHPTSGEVRAVAMADGRDVATLALPAAPVFDGVAAALGRVYVSTVDGKLLCLGAR
jgi:hypothetical protein